MNVFSLLSSAARLAPARTAFVAGSGSIVYREAAARALALAARLRARGVRAGDRVATLLPNTEGHWFAYFAAAACGAVLVPLNTRLSVGELDDILQHAEARLLLHDRDDAARAAELARTVANADIDALLAEATDGGDAEGADDPDGTAVAPDDPAQLYYTSGTTGRPKGVVLTHRNVRLHALRAVQELSLGGDDVWAHIAPMFHLADAWATFAITAVGGRHTFLPRFAADRALDLLERERVTITNLVPTMLQRMVAEPAAAERHYALRTMLSGGAPIAGAVVRRIMATFRCDYVQTYGMTETSPYLTLSLLDEPLRALPPERQLEWKCKTGRAFAGIELRVVDDHGHDVPRDGRSVGEIRVRGATVTPGYFRDPAATAAAFDASGFLCTGDLATIDAHGYVDIVDRKKDVIKTGAESVYSIEVENVLYAHPAVLECAVFATPHEELGEQVTAAVVAKPGQVLDAAELVAFCRERIAHFKAPRRVLLLDALPRTGSGKIQKRALRDRLA